MSTREECSVAFMCTAIHVYINNDLEINGLHLNYGQKYLITKTQSTGWWYATNEDGYHGWVPSNYLSIIKSTNNEKKIKLNTFRNKNVLSEYILCIKGYIRCFCLTNNIGPTQISNEIVELCLSYYYIIECFDNCNHTIINTKRIDYTALVCGYIRQHIEFDCNKFSMNDIGNICFAYFFKEEDDYLFTNSNINYGEKEEYLSPYSYYIGPSSWYQTIFGKCHFYSNIPNDGINNYDANIYEWIFYINDCKDEYSRVSICIDRWADGQFCRWDYTPPITIYTTVTVTLNMKINTLIYNASNSLFGVKNCKLKFDRWYPLKTDEIITYRMAICLAVGESITLLSFKIK
eukprot:1888_1